MEIKYNSLSTDHQQTYKYRPQYTTAIKLHQSTHHSVIRCLLTVFAGCSCFFFFYCKQSCIFQVLRDAFSYCQTSEWVPAGAFY